MKVGKKQVKTEPEIILEEITQEEEKVPIERLRWEKSHITAEIKKRREFSMTTWENSSRNWMKLMSVPGNMR